MHLNSVNNSDSSINKLKYLSKQLEHEGNIDERQFVNLLNACNLKIPTNEVKNL